MEPQGPQQQSQSQPQPMAQAFSASSAPVHHDTRALVILSVLVLVLLLAAIWGIGSYLNVSSNIEAQVVSQLESALTQQEEDLRAEFKTSQESDTRKYVGPSVFRNPELSVPKNWSVYEDSSTNETPVSVTFHPDSVSKDTVSNGLRFVILNQDYESFIAGYQAKISKNLVTSTSVKNGDTLGVKLTGAITADEKDDGFAVVFPLRDKTLALWTESKAYKAVFDQAVTSLKFTP